MANSEHLRPCLACATRNAYPCQPPVLQAEDDEQEVVKATSTIGKIKSSHELAADPKLLNIVAPDEADDADDGEGESAEDAAPADSAPAPPIREPEPKPEPEQPVKKTPQAEVNGDDEADFDSMMRARIQRKHDKKSGKADAVAAAAKKVKEPKMTLLTAEDRINASRDESKRLIADMKKSKADAAAAGAAKEEERPTKRSEAQQFLDEQNDKYESSRGGLKKSKARRQDQTMELLAKFRSKLTKVTMAKDESDESDVPEDDDEYDQGW